MSKPAERYPWSLYLMPNFDKSEHNPIQLSIRQILNVASKNQNYPLKSQKKKKKSQTSAIQKVCPLRPISKVMELLRCGRCCSVCSLQRSSLDQRCHCCSEMKAQPPV